MIDDSLEMMLKTTLLPPPTCAKALEGLTRDDLAATELDVFRYNQDKRREVYLQHAKNLLDK